MASAVEGRHLLEGNLCNKSLGLVLLRECESESARGGEGVVGGRGKSVQTSLEGTGKVGLDLDHHMYLTIAIERLQPPNSSSFRHPFLN